MRTIFLDHQSSTPLLPEAFEAMQPHLAHAYGNPSALHRHGLKARSALSAAREQFAAFTHAESPDNLIFTSGGTEAVNLAIKGFAWANAGRGKHIVLSDIEHPAVTNSVAFLESQGFTATRVGVDRVGTLRPEAVHAAMTDQTILICAHQANHDVGTIQPIQELAGLAQERGVPLFVDAVASAGWLPIDVQAMGISLLALSAHRFYGPKGVGVLYRHRTVRLTSLVHGGDQEQGRRAGTENVPAIVGAGVAAQAALAEMSERTSHTAKLQRRLWDRVRTTVGQVALNGPEPGPGRLSTNLNLSAEFTEGEGQLLSLDMAGVAVASGTSCVSRAVKVSPVLEAMGLDRALAMASIIFSFGVDNSEEEIDFVAGTYAKVIERLRKMSPLWEDFQAGRLSSALPSADEPRSRLAPPR